MGGTRKFVRMKERVLQGLHLRRDFSPLGLSNNTILVFCDGCRICGFIIQKFDPLLETAAVTSQCQLSMFPCLVGLSRVWLVVEETKVVMPPGDPERVSCA